MLQASICGWLVRHAVNLQAGGPAANSILLIAVASCIHKERTALLVVWSYLLALVSLPAWWWRLVWVGSE